MNAGIPFDIRIDSDEEIRAKAVAAFDQMRANIERCGMQELSLEVQNGSATPYKRIILLMLLKSYSNKELQTLIGERAKTYRKNLSLSQEELAANSGISLSTVQKFETGKANISLNNLLTILRHLGLIENIDQLIPEQPENPYRNFRY